MRFALPLLVLLASSCRPARPPVLVLDSSVHDGMGLDLSKLTVIRFDPAVRPLADVMVDIRDSVPERVIVLSDGNVPSEKLEPAVRRLAEDGATVSAICPGTTPGFDAALMSRIAEWGRGRFLFTGDRKSIPKILAIEIQRR